MYKNEYGSLLRGDAALNGTFPSLPQQGPEVFRTGVALKAAE